MAGIKRTRHVFETPTPISKLTKKELEEQVRLCEAFTWFNALYIKSSWQHKDMLHLTDNKDTMRAFNERKDALEQALQLKEVIVQKIRTSTDQGSEGPKPYRKRVPTMKLPPKWEIERLGGEWTKESTELYEAAKLLIAKKECERAGTSFQDEDGTTYSGIEPETLHDDTLPQSQASPTTIATEL